MKQLPRVRCMLGETDCRWHGVKVEHRLVVMRLPKRDRRWNPNIRAWVTPVWVVATLPEWLEEAGYEVVVIDVSRVIEPRDWHQVYAEKFGRACPHRRKPKTTGQAAVAAREPISTTEWKEAA